MHLQFSANPPSPRSWLCLKGCLGELGTAELHQPEKRTFTVCVHTSLHVRQGLAKLLLPHLCCFPSPTGWPQSWQSQSSQGKIPSRQRQRGKRLGLCRAGGGGRWLRLCPWAVALLWCPAGPCVPGGEWRGGLPCCPHVILFVQRAPAS